VFVQTFTRLICKTKNCYGFCVPGFITIITQNMVTGLMKATWTDPCACSFRSCSQLANSFLSLLMEHLLKLCRLLGSPPPRCSPLPSILRQLINSLEAASTAAGGKFCCLWLQLPVFKHLPQCHLESWVNMPDYSGIAHRHMSLSFCGTDHSIGNWCILCTDLWVMSALSIAD
jgi:hypothetical protein